MGKKGECFDLRLRITAFEIFWRTGMRSTMRSLRLRRAAAFPLPFSAGSAKYSFMRLTGRIHNPLPSCFIFSMGVSGRDSGSRLEPAAEAGCSINPHSVKKALGIRIPVALHMRTGDASATAHGLLLRSESEGSSRAGSRFLR